MFAPTRLMRSARMDPRLLTFSFFFLLSGIAGLVYQIVWERLLELYFGVTMVAITLIVTAFMAGLGLGSLLGGRIARSLKEPLLTYGLVELGIALFGLFSPVLILWVGRVTAGSAYVLVFLISFILLLVPTVLMGMTLPLLAQAFIDRVETSGGVIGLLYGINTLGAALGSLLAGFILIARTGLDGAVRVAVLLNVLIGLLALLMARLRRSRSLRSAASPAADQTDASPAAGRAVWGFRTILAVSFLVGFIGLGYEMLWMRVLGILNKSTVYNFPAVLFVYLLALAVGGYLWGRRSDRSADAARLFWKIEVGVALLAAGGFLLIWKGFSAGGSLPWVDQFLIFQRPISPVILVEGVAMFGKRLLMQDLYEYFLPILLLVLPAGLLMGGGLPILDRLSIETPDVAGRRIGDIHLANILGSVFGTLVISFLLLPSLGSEWTLRVLMGLSLCFPLLYAQSTRGGRTQPLRTRLELAAFPAMILVLLVLLPGRGQFYVDLYQAGTGGRAVVAEAADTVMAFTYPEDSPDPKVLWLGGETHSYFPSLGVYEVESLVCSGATDPERVLVIGLGGGHTTFFMLAQPGIREIVVVELMQDLDGFLAENIPYAHGPLADPRLRFVVDDGRRYLYTHPEEKFDLIIIDPLRNYTAGHNALYSVEALNLYGEHLSDGGVICLWFDQPNVIPATTAQVFPYVDQFAIPLLVASHSPIEYDLASMQSSAQAYLDYAGDDIDPAARNVILPINSLANFRRDQDGILLLDADRQVLTDLNPYLEYYFLDPVFPEDAQLDVQAIERFLKRITGCDQQCQAIVRLYSKH